MKEIDVKASPPRSGVLGGRDLHPLAADLRPDAEGAAAPWE